MEKQKHFVKDSTDLVKKIKDLEVPPWQKLTSYYVSALFTSIPTDDAIKVIRTYLEKDQTLPQRTALSVEQLLQLFTFCLNTTYFVYDSKNYKQAHGAAMGSPVSPIVANIYMEDFESRALTSAHHPPSLWLRYVEWYPNEDRRRLHTWVHQPHLIGLTRTLSSQKNLR